MNSTMAAPIPDITKTVTLLDERKLAVDEAKMEVEKLNCLMDLLVIVVPDDNQAGNDFTRYMVYFSSKQRQQIEDKIFEIVKRL